jgi:peptidoglycan/xylan/chitin deacetylase (PgdA/CDA1 family)
MSFIGRIGDYFCYWRAQFLGRRSIRLTNRNPVITFTFDDFPRSALERGGAILEEHGLTGTYYAALGLADSEAPVGRIFSEEDLHQVVVRGHELGCHTFDHCHGWNTAPKLFEDSVLRNRQALNRILPGATFRTHSYPFALAHPRTKQRIRNYFACSRGGPSGLNCGRADLNYLKAVFLETSNSETIKKLIELNNRQRGWLIFGTHDISNNPTRFGCTPAFFTEVVRLAVNSGAKILPMVSALDEVSRQECVTQA